MPLAAALLALQFFAVNRDLGYRFELPQGFIGVPGDRTLHPDIVDCWSEPMPASPSGALMLCVHRMRGVLPHEAMRAEELPRGAVLLSFTWKGFDVQGIRTDTTRSGMRMTAFVTQVPLREEAIQLSLAGPSDQASRMQAIMTSTLASLEGDTNWLTTEERASRLGQGVGAMLALVVLAIGARIWRNRRAQAA